MFIKILGYIAASLTTVAFVPQLYKVLKTKDTSTISLYMYFCFVTGIICWFIYGLFVKDYAIIFANGITAVLSLIILIIKITNVIKGEKP